MDGGPLPAQPQFPEPPLRANSYTQAPVVAALPDFFTAILYKTGQPEHFVKGQLVSPELATGFDPNEPDPTSFQPGEDGDLKFPESLRWIFNFDEAEKKGLAIRIPLSEAEFAAGFDKLVVLGVKVSAGKQEGKELLEDLFQSQLYQEKGMYVLPQGTPTNNFESAKSGYNWPEQEAARYFKATWKGGHVWSEAQSTDPFFPAGRDSTDTGTWHRGGFFQEAAGRGWRGRARGACDEPPALSRNLGLLAAAVLFAATLGSAVECRADVFREVRYGARLAACIRIGQQPYGILPATAFKFWKSKDPQDFAQRLLDQILEKTGSVLGGFEKPGSVRRRRTRDCRPAERRPVRLAGNDPASSRFAQQALFGEGYLNLHAAAPFLSVSRTGRRRKPQQSARCQSVSGAGRAGIASQVLGAWRFFGLPFHARVPQEAPARGSLDRRAAFVRRPSLQTFPGSTWNYLDWLFQSSVEALWKEQFQNVPLAAGSAAAVPPKALLYHFARFALRRSALESALRLLEPDEKLRLLKTRDLELLSILSDAGSEFTPATLNDQNLIQRTLKPLVQASAFKTSFFWSPTVSATLGK